MSSDVLLCGCQEFKFEHPVVKTVMKGFLLLLGFFGGFSV